MAKTTFWHSKWFKRVFGALVIIVVFLLGGWVADGGLRSDGGLSYAPESSVRSLSGTYDDYADYDYEGSLSASPSGDSYEDLDTETRIIKTGSLTIDVKLAEESLASITEIATAYGGFIQSSYTWLQADETTAGSVTLRVDVDQFETAMESIKALATVVQSESVSGEDVTQEYVDLQARLTTYEAEEAQYLEILEYATSVEEMLQVIDYLTYVREDIEYIKGQLEYMENRTDYSTITVYVYEEASIIAPTSDWQPWVEVKTAFNSLVVLAQSLVNLGIWVVMFGVPVLVVIWVVKRVRRRAKRKK